MNEKNENSTPLFKKPIFEVWIIISVILFSFFVLYFFTSNTKLEEEHYQTLDYLVEYPSVPIYRSYISHIKHDFSATSTLDISVNVEMSFVYNENTQISYSVSKYSIDKGMFSDTELLYFLLDEIVEGNHLVISTSSELFVSSGHALDFLSSSPFYSNTKRVQGRIIATKNGEAYALISMCAVGCNQLSYQKFINSFSLQQKIGK